MTDASVIDLFNQSLSDHASGGRFDAAIAQQSQRKEA